MNYNELTAIDDSKWFQVLAPIKRAKSVKENPVIIGFDTEYVYRDEKQETISIQFASTESSQLFSVSIPTSLQDYIFKIALASYADEPAFPTDVSLDELF